MQLIAQKSVVVEKEEEKDLDKKNWKSKHCRKHMGTKKQVMETAEGVL